MMRCVKWHGTMLGIRVRPVAQARGALCVCPFLAVIAIVLTLFLFIGCGGGGDGGGGDEIFLNEMRVADGILLAVANLDGDGYPDLITDKLNADGTRVVSVRLGNGDGTFQPEQSIAEGDDPLAVSGIDWIAVADLDGDGYPDLITDRLNADGTRVVSVQLGNGDGTFQPEQSSEVGNDDDLYPLRVHAVVDLDGDGYPDLIIDNLSTDGTRVVSERMGNGDGTFQPEKSIAEGSGSVAVADLDGDGQPDLVIAKHGPNGTGIVSVRMGNGDGTFQPEQSSDVGDDDDLGSVSVGAVADLDDDGQLDVVLSLRSTLAPGFGNDVSVLLGNSDGTFQSEQSFDVGDDDDLDSVGVNAVADLNGDGHPDLVINRYRPFDDDFIIVLLGNGDGTFQSEQTVAKLDGPVAVADLNGDGRPDLVTANHKKANDVYYISVHLHR